MNPLRLAWATFGRILVARAAATASALLLAGVIILAPNGLRPVDLVAWMARSIPTHLGVWAIWLTFTVPPIGHALRAPGVMLARSFPVSERTMIVLFFGMAAVVQLPFSAVMWRGGGLLLALHTSVLMLLTTAWLVARSRRSWTGAALGLLLSFAPPWLGIACGVPLACGSCAYAWRRGAEPSAALGIPFPRGAALALTSSQVLYLVRIERARTLLALTAWALMRFVGFAVVRSGLLTSAYLVLLPASVLAAAALAPPLASEAARLSWISPRAWLPLACSAGLLAAAALVVAPWAAPVVLVVLLVAERARRRAWRASRYGLAMVALAVTSGVALEAAL